MKNEKRILKKIFDWLGEKPGQSEEDFRCDFHIDQWCKIESKADWLEVGMAMYSLLQANIKRNHPHLRL